jgi:hypothetical protein
MECWKSSQKLTFVFFATTLLLFDKIIQYDDTYDEFISFQVDETQVDMDSMAETLIAKNDKKTDDDDEDEDDDNNSNNNNNKRWSSGAIRGRGGRGGRRTDRPKVDLTKRTTESLRARAQKHKNKGRSANHNRKKKNQTKMGSLFQ